MTYMYPVSGQ